MKGDNARPSSIPYRQLAKNLERMFGEKASRDKGCPECGGRAVSTKYVRDSFERQCKSCKHVW